MKPTSPAAMLSANIIAETKALAREVRVAAEALAELREDAYATDDLKAVARINARINGLRDAIGQSLAEIDAIERSYQR